MFRKCAIKKIDCMWDRREKETGLIFCRHLYSIQTFSLLKSEVIPEHFQGVQWDGVYTVWTSGLNAVLVLKNFVNIAVLLKKIDKNSFELKCYTSMSDSHKYDTYGRMWL